MTKPIRTQRLTEAGSVGTGPGTGNPSGALARRTRPARHGAYLAARTGELPERLAWLRPELDAFTDGLTTDKGGPDCVTVAEAALIQQARRLLTLTLLLHWNVLTRGATTRKGELRPPLNALAAYENALRHTLTALGLGRRMKDAMTLSGYLAAREAAGRGEAIGAGNGSALEGDGDRPAAADVEREP